MHGGGGATMSFKLFEMLVSSGCKRFQIKSKNVFCDPNGVTSCAVETRQRKWFSIYGLAQTKTSNLTTSYLFVDMSIRECTDFGGHSDRSFSTFN